MNPERDQRLADVQGPGEFTKPVPRLDCCGLLLLASLADDGQQIFAD
jgi:hypothetical protein